MAKRKEEPIPADLLAMTLEQLGIEEARDFTRLHSVPNLDTGSMSLRLKAIQVNRVELRPSTSATWQRTGRGGTK